MHYAGGIVHAMGPEPTAALVNEVGAAPIGQLVVAMGPDLAAAVVHEMGVDLTADLVGALGVGTASGIVQSAGGAETGALVRALGAEFVAQLVTAMGVTQNVALVAALGPGMLASLVAAMGPAFIASLSVSMSAEIFQAIFGAGSGNGAGGEGSSSPDRPVSPADTYRSSGTGIGGSSSSISAGVSGLRVTPVTVPPSQRVVIPTVTVADNSSSGSAAGGSKLMPHLADGARIPVAAPRNSSSVAGAVAADPDSHPIATASTASTALSIDSTAGIPAVPASAAPMWGVRFKEGLGGSDGTRIQAVPLTHNAQQVMADVERKIRDQGGRF